MRTRSLTLGILLIMLFSSFTAADVKTPSSAAQGSFDYFKAHRKTKKGVILKWGSHSYYTLEFSIERSLDGVDYQQVNFVIDNWEGHFQYLDTEVPTGRIHYRLVAMLADGTYETSEVEVVQVEYND